MNFYEELSRHYDEIFPAREADAAFVRGLLGGKSPILDIGCGTGSKTALLQTPECTGITGIDADAGMIDAARRKHSAKGISFMVLDMRDLAGAFTPGGFDAAVCLGNTLAHLTRPGELENLFRQVRTVVRPGGTFVGQLLNYDRILNNRVDSLPVIETPSLVFTRTYEWRDDGMHFISTLRYADGEECAFDTPLSPIRHAELAEALDAAGCAATEFFGGFAGEPYEGNSYHIVFRSTV